MYSIYCDNILIYKDTSITDAVYLIDPILTLKENAAGTLNMTMPPMNAGYHDAECMTSTIHVYLDRNEYWRGRILTEDKDFMNRRKFTCEGAFSFLNDIVAPPQNLSGLISEVLDDLLDIYNENVAQNRQILKGNINISSYVEIKTDNYQPIYDIIKTFIIDQYNGCFKIRCNNGTAYLDYVEMNTSNDQSITFGENLLDFTSSLDQSDIVTVLIPLGPKDNETGEYMTIVDVGTDGIYYENTSMMDRYGRYEKVQEFSDAEDELDLLAKAEDWMTKVQYQDLVLEVSAIDLNYLDHTTDKFEIWDKVWCISDLHGLNQQYPITEMTIEFNRPENNKIILGNYKEKTISGTINQTIDARVNTTVPPIVKNEIAGLDWPEITDDIVEHKVIKAETMMATFCYTKYLLVNFVETNFDAIDAHGTNPSRSHSHRTYIRIIDEKIYFFEDELTDNIVQYEFPANKPLYWTAIDGDRAFQYFTYEDPCNINQDKRPSGLTDDEFRAMYAVKVWGTAQNGHHEKGYIGFSEVSTQVMEPVIKLGVGDGNGNGIGTIYKSTNGLDIYYSSRTLQQPFGFRVKDDGYYAIIGSLERRIALPLLYSSLADAQNDVGTIPQYSAAALIAPGISNGGGS